MKEDLELVRGSNNPFDDVGLPAADTKLIKADFAAEILAILRERRLTGVAATKLVGVQTADTSRIRNADLSGLPSPGWSRSSTASIGMWRCAGR